MSVTSRYFTPHRCHTSHAVTGAIGVATAFALPGTVAGEHGLAPGNARGRRAAPAGPDRGRGRGRASRTARSWSAAPRSSARPGRSSRAIFTCPTTCSRRPHRPPVRPWTPARCSVGRSRPVQLIVPTPAGGANDAIARAIARNLGPLLGRPVVVDNRAGAHGSIASEHVARASTGRRHPPARLRRHPRHAPGDAEPGLRPGRRLRAGRSRRVLPDGPRRRTHRAGPDRRRARHVPAEAPGGRTPTPPPARGPHRTSPPSCSSSPPASTSRASPSADPPRRSATSSRAGPN